MYFDYVILNLIFIALTWSWSWTIRAFLVKETTQLLFNGKVIVNRNNKIMAWAMLVLTVFNTASFIFFSVVSAQ